TTCRACGAGDPSKPEGGAGGPGAWVEGKGIAGTPILEAQTVREWVTRPTIAGGFAPVVTVRGVLNMEEFHSTGSYTPTPKIRDHLHLAHSACTFPFCTAAAWTCDADHCKP